MEFHRVPEEFTPPPEEYRVPAEPVDRPGEEFSPRPAARRRSADRHRLLKRLMLVPLAAAVASAALWMSSFGYDPLGVDAPERGSETAPGEDRSSGYEIHVTYAPTGESAVFTGEDEEQALSQARTWVADRGGDPDGMRYLREEKFLVDTIYSDDCIIVGDPDDMEHAYIAQGTVTYVYRWEIYYEAYDADDAFPVLPNWDPDFAGDYAWSGQGSEEYVRLYSAAEQDYTYLQMGGVWAGMGGREGDVPGASYDRDRNVLTLENFSGDVLDVNLMGNGFTIRLIGENRLGQLVIWGAGYAGSVTFTGDGRLTVDGGDDSIAILLNAEGSQSCLMVDRGVTVEARSNRAAVVIRDTAMDPAVYCRRGVTVAGGTDAVVDRTEVDGTTYYTHAVEDENGNLSTYVRFGAE
ncbi:MAG: hypothetical protein II458_01320 [Oscillospiraceae bacterium]|nr:hypothetical protein [Oscillospiraceae bacterium]